MNGLVLDRRGVAELQGEGLSAALVELARRVFAIDLN